jgi:hypothetical protein
LDNKGRPKTDLKINWTKILDTRIGRYTATALIVVSTPQRDIPYQIETSFWVFPWKLVVGILLFIIFALIGFLNTFRNIIKKILKIFNKKNNND